MLTHPSGWSPRLLRPVFIRNQCTNSLSFVAWLGTWSCKGTCTSTMGNATQPYQTNTSSWFFSQKVGIIQGRFCWNSMISCFNHLGSVAFFQTWTSSSAWQNVCWGNGFEVTCQEPGKIWKIFHSGKWICEVEGLCGCMNMLGMCKYQRRKKITNLQTCTVAAAFSLGFARLCTGCWC